MPLPQHQAPQYASWLLQQTEGDLERAEERAEMNEMKILELEEELKVNKGREK